jgi:hypothetical protein
MSNKICEIADIYRVFLPFISSILSSFLELLLLVMVLP